MVDDDDDAVLGKRFIGVRERENGLKRR